MAKRVKRNPYRIAFQLLIVALLGYLVIRPFVDRSYIADFEAYCPFGGLQAFSSYITSNSLACSMTATQIFMGLALIAGVILFSKLFCSHICPIGTFTEWLGRMGGKLKVNFTVKGIADRLLRIVKYALLFITFYFTISSSELFCKKFDPYYAVFSGFSSDIVISYVAITLLLVIAGSFFIRQFWCKYACPLSAASNIFSNSYIFIGITALYALLTLAFHLSISWVWLLAALCIAGVLIETITLRTFGFSVFRINHNHEKCVSCTLCDKACPMSIKVTEYDKVQHIDCHLCGDCVAACPEKGALTIRHHTTLWLPGLAALILIVAGLGFSLMTDIPTISLKWGNKQQMANAGVYQQSGLTSIKCFGSSMSFANHMKELDGVLGVETFVSDHSVRVFYDKSKISDEDISVAIFTPVSRLLSAPDPGLSNVSVCEFSIDQFFDPNDADLLSTRFSQNKGILAMQTIFGEPVHAKVYYDPRQITPVKINALIEQRKVTWEEDGTLQVAKTNFKVAGQVEKPALTQQDYLLEMYEPVSLTFNGFEEYSADQLETIEFDFHDSADPGVVDMPWYLLSHLSNDNGVVSFESKATNHGFVLLLKIVKAKTSKQRIDKLINEPVLKVHLSDGTEESVPNPYKF